MTAAIRPVYAFIPMRNGTESFSADFPTYYGNKGADDDAYPADNPLLDLTTTTDLRA
jgi:hypothetical protein